MSSRVEMMLDAQSTTVTLSMGVASPPETVADDLKAALDKPSEFVWYGNGSERIMFRTSSVLCIQIKGDLTTDDTD